MRINRGAGRLRVERKAAEDVSPMEGMANLADVMLVFACGLIIALIAAWNVDVSKTPYNAQEVQSEGQTQEIDKDKLEEKGSVYMDPETGKYYVIEDE